MTTEKQLQDEFLRATKTKYSSIKFLQNEQKILDFSCDVTFYLVQKLIRDYKFKPLDAANFAKLIIPHVLPKLLEPDINIINQD